MYKGNLTKAEAMTAMKQGKKVGREYFSSNEYIELLGKGLTFEDGVGAYPEWWLRIEPTFSQPDDGKAWYIWKESK